MNDIVHGMDNGNPFWCSFLERNENTLILLRWMTKEGLIFMLERPEGDYFLTGDGVKVDITRLPLDEASTMDDRITVARYVRFDREALNLQKDYLELCDHLEDPNLTITREDVYAD